MKVRADDRLGLLIPCGRPGATLMRVTCPRAGHVEQVLMCRRCEHAITYCQECFDADRMLVRARLLAVA